MPSNNNKSFSFITITYNHSAFIIEHLESIKYQIVQYGAGWDCDLVVSDDRSSDNTVALVENWLIGNADLFRQKKIIVSEENQGIVSNFKRALISFDTSFFKILAGDDKYTSNSVFECLQFLEFYDVVQCGLIEFNGNEKLCKPIHYQYLSDFWYLSLVHLQKRARVGLFSFRAPGFFFSKRLITPDLLNDLSFYKYCEDRPLFFHLLLKQDLKFYFFDLPIVFYRISNSSIARNENHSAKMHLVADNILFEKKLLARKVSILEKQYLKYSILNHLDSPKRFLYYWTPLRAWYKLIHLVINTLSYNKRKSYLRSIYKLLN